MRRPHISRQSWRSSQYMYTSAVARQRATKSVGMYHCWKRYFSMAERTIPRPTAMRSMLVITFGLVNVV